MKSVRPWSIVVAVAAVLGAVALVAFFVGRGEEDPVSTGTTTTAPEPAAPVTTTTTATSTTTTTTTATTATTTIAPLTLTSVTDELDDYFGSMPLGWDCVDVTEDWSGESVTDPIPPGSVLRCDPAQDGPQEGENLPVVTVLALDAATVAVAQTDISSAAGLAVGGVLRPRFGSGRTCREVVDEAGLDAIEDELAYFALLGYWFIEGRPALMDIDDNGVPCETLFSPGVVDAVWAGGLIGSIGEISPAA